MPMLILAHLGHVECTGDPAVGLEARFRDPDQALEVQFPEPVIDQKWPVWVRRNGSRHHALFNSFCTVRKIRVNPRDGRTYVDMFFPKGGIALMWYEKIGEVFQEE